MSAVWEERSEQYRSAIEAYLADQFAAHPVWDKLYEAMRYSLLAGGKRIRPMLTLEFCRLNGGDWHTALPLGCALEMVHTYSLIHDDLPCMDDDDLRRGKPTNHKVYGEMLAVLAGDGLQGAAFEMIAGAPELSAQQRIDAVAVLAKACGPDGMVAGQVLDMTAHDTQEELELLHDRKTGAMIAAAAELGCVAANADQDARKRAVAYAKKLGLAFQIYDDVLDVIGTEDELGKPIGSDQAVGKYTFVDLLGTKGALDYASSCTESAKAALGKGDTGFLKELADRLIHRKN